jgi:hypothetical protein
MKWFGEDISKLVIGSHMRDYYISLDGMISQEVVLDIYVFRS